MKKEYCDFLITQDDYHELLRKAHLLDCMVENGVITWSGYNDSFKLFHQYYPNELENDYDFNPS